MKNNLKLLKDLIKAPSVSGFEQPAMRIVRDSMDKYSDEVKTDINGNVTGVLNPKGKLRVMLASHCDQIGFMVRYITDDGFIYFSPVGGINEAVVPGSKVLIHTGGQSINGIIGKQAIHLTKDGDKKRITKLNKLFIDIGAKTRDEAQKLVSIGDPVTFETSLVKLNNNLIAGAGMDDKAGVFIMCETLRLLNSAKEKLTAAVYGVATVQEEVRLLGAKTSTFDIDPHVGIAIDVGFATDYPGNKKTEMGEIVLGKGPIISRGPNINNVVFKQLVKIAEQNKILYQLQIEPGATGTDADGMQISRSGVATAVINIPNRYMHTQVETVSIDDLQASANLLVKYILSLNQDSNFIPY